MKRFWLRLHGLIFVLLLAAVLGLAAWLSARHSVSAYWGSAVAADLSTASQRLLGQLKGEVRARAFTPADNVLARHLSDLLAQYARHKSDFHYELIDPKARPDLVRELGIQRPGEIVLDYAGREERVAVPTEARVSAALERLARDQGQFIGFVTGHGERSLLGEANFDLGEFGKALEQKGYRLLALSLARDAIADNLSLLVLTPPQGDLLPGEVAALEAYVARGGNLLWLGDPGENSRLAPLAKRLGIDWQPGLVLDPAAAATLSVNDPRLVLLDQAVDHPVTRQLRGPVLLSQAQAFEVAPGEWKAQPLLLAQGGQFRTEDYVLGQPVRTPRQTPPLLLGAGLERPLKSGRQRVAVIGDGDFLSNEYLGNGANFAFGLNLIDWLTESELFLDTYTRSAPDQVIELSRAETILLGIGFFVALPVLFLLAAGRAAWRRRRG